ncbi:MAG: hypothetical protein ABIK89_13380 [Planctomycetota bacterium]
MTSARQYAKVFRILAHVIEELGIGSQDLVDWAHRKHDQKTGALGEVGETLRWFEDLELSPKLLASELRGAAEKLDNP